MTMQLVKEIPVSRKAEACTVASCALDPAVIPLVFECCSVSDFTDSDYRECMDAIYELWQAGGGVDFVLLRQWLEDRGRASETLYASLREAADNTPTPCNAEYYAKIVRSKARERELIASAEKLSKGVYDKSLSVEERKELFEEAALELNLAQPGSEVQTLQAAAQERWQNLQAPTKEAFVPTGFKGIDEAVQGFQAGEFIIVAGRPSVGKSTMMLDMALNMSLQKMPVLVLSMEMNRQSLSDRAIVSLSRIPLARLRANDLSDYEKQRIEATIKNLSLYQLYIDDSPPMSPNALAAKVMKAKIQYGIRCVFVDYLQLMSLPRAKLDNRNVEVSKICRDLVALAKRVRVPLVVLSQLSRAVTHREEPKPRLSDLRDSGSIEQDADVVVFLYHDKPTSHKARPANYPDWTEPEPSERIVRCYIAKTRQGLPQEVEIDYYPAFFSFQKRGEEAQAPSKGGGDVPF